MASTISSWPLVARRLDFLQKQKGIWGVFFSAQKINHTPLFRGAHARNGTHSQEHGLLQTPPQKTVKIDFASKENKISYLKRSHLRIPEPAEPPTETPARRLFTNRRRRARAPGPNHQHNPFQDPGDRVSKGGGGRGGVRGVERREEAGQGMKWSVRGRGAEKKGSGRGATSDGIFCPLDALFGARFPPLRPVASPDE